MPGHTRSLKCMVMTLYKWDIFFLLLLLAVAPSIALVCAAASPYCDQGTLEN